MLQPLPGFYSANNILKFPKPIECISTKYMCDGVKDCEMVSMKWNVPALRMSFIAVVAIKMEICSTIFSVHFRKLKT